MPSVTLRVEEDGIYRFNERNNAREAVGNFTIKLVAAFDGDKNAEVGGPGFVASIKRFPDRVEKY